MTADTLATVAAHASQQPPTAFALCLILTLAIFSYHITAIAIGGQK